MLPVGTNLGNLRYGEIYLEFDGPQLFYCIDEFERKLISVHAPLSENGVDNWLFVYISEERIKNLKNNKLSIFNVFAFPEKGRIEHLRVFADGSMVVESVLPSTIPPDWLPEFGEYLSYSENVGLAPREPFDVSEAEEEIRQRALSFGSMWELSQDALDTFRRLKTPVNVVADRTRRFVLDVVWGAGSAVHFVDLGSFGVQALCFQRLLDALADVGLGRRDSSGISGAARDLARMNVVAVFPGSFGVRLESHAGRILPHPVIIGSNRQLLDLFAASSDQESLRKLLRHLGPKVALRYKALFRSLSENSADFSADFGVPGDIEAHSVKISQKEIIEVYSMLKKEEVVFREEFEFVGRLTGVSLRSKFFRIENEERIVAGRIGQGALSLISGKRIDKQHIAKIEVQVELDETTGKEEERYTLLSISALDADDVASLDMS